MQSRTSLRRALVAMLATTVVWVGCSTAQASADQRGASVSKYGKSAVTRAFRAAGIGLYDTGYGSIQPVITLASTKPHEGWSVAVYIYLTPQAAAETYKGSVKAWRGAGMAAALKKNIVIAVVPKNRITIAQNAKPWPMPALVAKTIASLPA